MPLKYKLEEVLTENSPVTRRVLISYLAKYNVLDYKCAICGNIGEWNGVSLTLQIDHINGIDTSTSAIILIIVITLSLNLAFSFTKAPPHSGQNFPVLNSLPHFSHFI